MLKDRKLTFYYAALCASAALLYLLIFGYKILKPWYTDWLYDYGDLEQHYLGAVGYRLGSWQFPIGNTDFLSYPTSSSVVFTDSIPLMAVLTKIFSFILPSKFQYFGMWGFFCFILQAVLGTKISYRLTQNRAASFAGGLLVCLVPSFLQRLYVHSSLSAHFVLLLAVYAFVSHEAPDPAALKENSRADNFRTLLRPLLMWDLIAFLATSMHLYLLLMCGMMLLGFVIMDAILTRKIYRAPLLILDYVITALLTLFLLGGFTNGNAPIDTGGFGICGFNLNSYFNPLYHSSTFFGELPSYGGNAENYAYLGLGIFLLAAASLVLAVVFRGKIGKISRKSRAYLISGAVVFVIVTVFATSPVVAAGDKVLFEMHVPEAVTKLWSIFRATGRVIWINIYLIIFLLVRLLGKVSPKKIAAAVVTVCLAVQIIDIFPLLKSKHETLAPTKIYVNNVVGTDGTWDRIVNENDIGHVVMLVDYEFYNRQRFDIAAWALEKGLTLNQFAISRSVFISDEFLKEMPGFERGSLYISNSEKLFFDTSSDIIVVPVNEGLFLGYVK